jgi:hypothetical protein
MQQKILPDILNLNGTWSEKEENLYNIFRKDFKGKNLIHDGIKVVFDARKIEGDKEEGFWHVITKTDFQTKERLLDFRRAERLHWIKIILEDSENELSIKRWNCLDKRRKKIRRYLWLEKEDFVVVLEKSKNKKLYILVTAYYIEGDSTRRSLNKKYGKRILG